MLGRTVVRVVQSINRSVGRSVVPVGPSVGRSVGLRLWGPLLHLSICDVRQNSKPVEDKANEANVWACRECLAVGLVDRQVTAVEGA